MPKRNRELGEEGWITAGVKLKWRFCVGVLVGFPSLHMLYGETAVQSVSVHACMSHCIGMLASGSSQL